MEAGQRLKRHRSGKKLLKPSSASLEPTATGDDQESVNDVNNNCSNAEDAGSDEDKKEKWTCKTYAIALFSLIGSLAFSSMIFLIPFVVDPAFQALNAEFHPKPVQCTLESAVVKVGLKSCAWSSCAEGCTRDLYKCFQIIVRIFNS